MSFYWGMAVLEAESMCRHDEWMPKKSVTAVSMQSMPCPVGTTHGNDGPLGAHRNITCQHGHDVSECGCVQMTCPGRVR